MNILFATLVDIENIGGRGIYQDLMREIAGLGHNVYVMSPNERRKKKQQGLARDELCAILKVRTGNITKTNKAEKAVATVLLEHQYVWAARKFLRGVKFDLVIYSTPPVTLAKLVKYIKKRDGAASYLLLKDIFPQNAADLGFFPQGGLIYRAFRRKERSLYSLSDYIGCMSLANVRYLLLHNSSLDPGKVHVCPNSISPLPFDGKRGGKAEIREKYGLPQGGTVFVYGGNLGKPQCVPFIVECLKQNKDMDGRFFIICGDGVDASALKEYIKNERPSNVRLLGMLPKDEYDDLLLACDVGLVFLDNRFTIPNFPSRLLSYMEHGLAVLAATDAATDLGEIVAAGEFGWSCGSGSAAEFKKLVDMICENGTGTAGAKGREYLESNYLASQSAKIILDCATK